MVEQDPVVTDRFAEVRVRLPCHRSVAAMVLPLERSVVEDRVTGVVAECGVQPAEDLAEREYVERGAGVEPLSMPGLIALLVVDVDEALTHSVDTESRV